MFQCYDFSHTPQFIFTFLILEFRIGPWESCWHPLVNTFVKVFSFFNVLLGLC